MSAKSLSRDYALGQIKKLRRMKRPLILTLNLQLPVRNPVARAMAQRAASAGAGKHVRSQGANRRAEHIALKKAIQNLDTHLD